MAAFVLPLSALDASALPVGGGKAANLGELLRAGFAVPEGFCITTAAYRRLLEAGIARPLAELLASLDAQDAQQLASRAAAIRELFYRASVPQDILQELRIAAKAYAGEPLAVRSSATAEDLPEASFAGQQETYLTVVGDESLVDAVRRCWASLWTDRAIAYRQRNGIAHASVALAVVVQRMVQAEAAGVLFTANPVSGKRTELTMEASFGLGEAVVGGLVTPDSYIVDKRRLRIVDRQIKPKTVQVIGQAGGGTARVDIGDSASRPALSDGDVLRLAEAGIEIEGHFGQPQDVEWALADGKLWVLQSRPITSLYPAPPPAPEDELRVYLSLNAAQGMLEPFTPMGASVFQGLARTVVGSDERSPLVVLGGRLFADVTGLLRSRLGRQLPKSALPQVEPVAATILQRLMCDPRLRPAPEPPLRTIARLLFRHGRKVLPILLRALHYVASPTYARRHIGDAVVPRLATVRATAYRPLAPGEQVDVLRHFARAGLLNIFIPNLIPAVAAGMFCFMRAEALVRHHGLDARLLVRARQGLPYNKTTTMDLELWALAQRLRADVVAAEALRAGDPRDLAERYRAGTLPSTLQVGMAAFLARYGHRGIREIDVGMPRWAEDASYLFGVLHSYLATGSVDPTMAPDRHFARQGVAGDEAVAQLVAQARRLRFGPLRAAVLGFLLHRYRELGGLRETPKFYAVWLFQALRDMLRSAGERLVALGLLDRADDVFYLRIEELGYWSSVEELGSASAPGRAPDPRRLVAERRRAYQAELVRRRAPRVLTSEGEAFYGEALPAAGNALGGTPASPGVSRGPAHVILNPLGARLVPGEMLVAPSTDPAWTPLFLVAGGLVMEAGGMMSHGAIVAREYGIPAVVGVAEATHRIATGQQLEVDGDHGLVKILS